VVRVAYNVVMPLASPLKKISEVLGFSKTDLPLGLSCVAELLSRCVHGSARPPARPRELEDFPRPFWNRWTTAACCGWQAKPASFFLYGDWGPVRLRPGQKAHSGLAIAGWANLTRRSNHPANWRNLKNIKPVLSCIGAKKGQNEQVW